MKRKNMLRRNSGFIIGCVIAAGVSFVTADAVMSDRVSLRMSSTGTEEETETVKQADTETAETRIYETDAFTVTSAGKIIKGVQTEKEETETEAQTDENGNVITPETDENGNVITPETDENGNVIAPETDENGNAVSVSGDGSGNGSQDDSGTDSSSQGSSSYDGSGSDGSYDGGNSDSSYDSGSSGGSYDGGSSGGSSGGHNIVITDPGNGDYYYDNSGSGSGSGSSSGSTNGAYTPDDVIIWGISSRYIDESELYNYSAGQLRLIRNEIFALHGRIFRSQDLADYFSQKSWYVPTYDPDEFDANMFYYLNDYEEANLNVILNYEAALAGN